MDKPTTIQQTGKRYGAQFLASTVLCSLGAALIIADSPLWGAGLLFAGLLWLLAARFFAWRQHG